MGKPKAAHPVLERVSTLGLGLFILAVVVTAAVLWRLSTAGDRQPATAAPPYIVQETPEPDGGTLYRVNEDGSWTPLMSNVRWIRADPGPVTGGGGR